MRFDDFRPAPIYYFAYGMLTDPRIMSEAEYVGTAVLRNHQLEFRGYANVIPGPGNMQGVLWSLDRKKLHELDLTEGYPTLYDRKTVPVFVNGRRFEAMIYTMTPETRERLEGRPPSRNYIMRLVKGYNAADISLQQISQALAQDGLNEAAMNPRAFDLAVKQGADQGVLVGYEFEVCVPAATIRSGLSTGQGQETTTPAITYETVANALENYTADLEQWTYGDAKFNTFLNVFKFKDPNIQYRDVKTIRKAMMQDLLPTLLAEFNSIPAHIRARYVPVVMASLEQDNNYRRATQLGKQFKFAREFGMKIYYTQRGQVEASGSRLARIGRQTQSLEEVLAWALGVTGFDLDHNFLNYFTFDDPQAAYDYLELSDRRDDDDEDYYDDDPEYTKAAKDVLQPSVQNTFGRKTNIFSDYHQRRKNLTDWYIEPDASIEPAKEADAAAEIVSPPYPAAEAMDVLNQFYAMAGQLNLYTNNSTGLHINVSIPKTLDVLKLAVFLGDQYVLKQFGRESSGYAQSVMRDLLSRAPRPTEKPVDVKKLQDLAKSIASAHSASISSNGKYISFRHAGGDYLKNYQEVANSVGRFINAMLIASDTNLYRNEYLGKLTRLFPTQPKSIKGTGKKAERQRTLARIQDIRMNGVPTIVQDVGGTGRAKLNKTKDFTIISTEPNSEAAKQTLLSRARMALNKGILERLPVANFARITFLQPIDQEFKFNNDVGKLGSSQRYTFYTLSPGRLPPGHPVTLEYIKSIAKPILAKKAAVKKTAKR